MHVLLNNSHNLPKKRPLTRKIFTFTGIQSTHSVTHRVAEKKVYNNVYPDVSTDTGLGVLSIEVIPMTLRKRVKRPASQLENTIHKKHKIQHIGKWLKINKARAWKTQSVDRASKEGPSFRPKVELGGYHMWVVQENVNLSLWNT